MTKYSLVMTPTPCRVAGYIISIRTCVFMRLCVYVLQREHPKFSKIRLSHVNISETVEDRARVTINGLYGPKAVHGLSIAATIYDHEMHE